MEDINNSQNAGSENKDWVNEAFNEADKKVKEERDAQREIVYQKGNRAGEIFDKEFTQIITAFHDAFGEKAAVVVMTELMRHHELMQFCRACFGSGYIHDDMCAQIDGEIRMGI